MTTRTRKPATKKELTVIARYTLNRNGHICYSYRPSKKDEQPYCTTVINGKATGCTCPARANFKKHVACKHMAHAEAVEAQRTAKASDITYEQAVEQAYAQLGATKNVQVATYGSCGHLVKPGMEHDMCGGCYQALYA
jgi:hypothetical protein